MYTPLNPSFFYIKVGFKAVKIICNYMCLRDDWPSNNYKKSQIWRNYKKKGQNINNAILKYEETFYGRHTKAILVKINRFEKECPLSAKNILTKLRILFTVSTIFTIRGFTSLDNLDNLRYDYFNFI